MRKAAMIAALAGIFIFSETDQIQAQGFLKKLKDKASEVADKAVDKKIDKATGTETSATNTNTNDATQTNRSGRASNKGGGGLSNSTPPDVLQQMSEAETAQSSRNFSGARYSLQQALLGIELQMGKQILTMLPASVISLPKDTLEDKVTSTKYGWNNLSIQRLYKKDDKEFSLLIGNNPAFAYMDLYFSGNYTQSGGEQNMKPVKVQGNKALIKYSDNEGYTLLVQLGQAGMITFQGVNISNEQEMMTAVNAIDIAGIKKVLGEK